jgi:hypothetical protein
MRTVFLGRPKAGFQILEVDRRLWTMNYRFNLIFIEADEGTGVLRSSVDLENVN